MKLRVFTLNTWALFWPLGKDVVERVRAIGSELERLDVDVAAFQEIWREDARKELVEAGRRAGLDHAWHDPHTVSAGGLLVLTRFPIRRASFEPFTLGGRLENLHHGDYLGGKGFATVELDTALGPLHFVATHLHAAYAPRAHDPYVGHRTGQVVQLATHLRGLDGPLVAAGDFNFEDAFEEYAIFRGLTGVADTARALDRRAATVLADPEYLGSKRASEARIDYLFWRDGTRRSLQPLEIERLLDGPLEIRGRPARYSDHAALRAEFEIADGGAPPAPISSRAVAQARELLQRGKAECEELRNRQRAFAAGSLLAAPCAFAGTRSALSRRRFLSSLGYAAASLAGVAGTGSLLLAEVARPAELRAFDRALLQLDALAASGEAMQT